MVDSLGKEGEAFKHASLAESSLLRLAFVNWLGKAQEACLNVFVLNLPFLSSFHWSVVLPRGEGGRETD